MSQFKPYTTEQFRHIQASIGGSDLLLGVSMRLRSLLKARGFSTAQVTQIHDSIEITCDPSERERLTRLQPEINEIIHNELTR